MGHFYLRFILDILMMCTRFLIATKTATSFFRFLNAQHQSEKFTVEKATAYYLPQKSATFFAFSSIKLVLVRNKCYQRKLICNGTMNEWCKLLTTKPLTEVNRTYRKLI